MVYVDAANPASSDLGPGTTATPFRTISAAARIKALPGNTILVSPGIYRETVTLSVKGSSASRVVLQAAGPGVIISGADDYSKPATWATFSGAVYLATSIDWAPAQVFLDGARLIASSDPPSSLPPRSFRYIEGIGLYVNAGGPNPGTRTLEVGRRAYGIVVKDKYMTIDGFVITKTESRAVDISGYGVIVQNCAVTFANSIGIQLSKSPASTVSGCVVADNFDHGIYLTDSSASSRVANNECYRNVRPSARAANGININGSPSCTVENNRCYDNQDSGIQFYNGSHNGISRNNVSWINGDHGYDHVASTGVRHLHDVAYRNYKDGFSIEGSSSGCSLHNCIATDNGLTTNEFNLWVDATSAPGLSSNYNIFWNSVTLPPIRYGTTNYSLSKFQSVTGQDANSKQKNPLFIFPAAGNFRVMTGSPAIDVAKGGIAGWPSTDAAGLERFDDPAMFNYGGGTPTYADIGAYEYRPAGSRPVSRLKVTPLSGQAPLTVTADASTSFDTDGTIVAYYFEFGDGVVVGPQTSPRATGVLGTGLWTVQVTVVDDLGQTATSSVKIPVQRGDIPPVVTSVASVEAIEGLETIFPVTVTDADGDSIETLTMSGSDLPAGPVFTPGATRKTGTFAWTPAPGTARTEPYVVTFAARNSMTGSASTSIRVLKPNQFPTSVLTANAVAGAAPLTVTLDASASTDPDGRITSYRFDFGDGSQQGPQSTPTAEHVYAAGRWNAQVVVTDDRGGSSVSSLITIQSLNPDANLALNPGFEKDAKGWLGAGPDTLFRVAGGRTGAYAVELRSASTNSTVLFGLNDSPDMVTNAGPAGSRYHFEAWVRSAANRGLAKLRVREYNAGVLQGPNALSTGVPLTPAWQKLSIDYTTLTANSVLDFNVLDAAVVAGEVFQVDDILMQSSAMVVPVLSVPPVVSVDEDATVTFTVTASDPDGEAISSLAADLSTLPPGSNATFTTNASNTQGTFSWKPTFDDSRSTAYSIRLTAKNSGTGTATGAILVRNIDRAPALQFESPVAAFEGRELVLSFPASDPDGDAISLLSADLSGLPAGHGATFSPNATRTGGTLRWTPPAGGGARNYPVSFTAANALSATRTLLVHVEKMNHAPVVTAPGLLTVNEGEPLSITVSASDLDEEAIVSLTTDLSGLPAGHSAVFTPGDSRDRGILSWTPSMSDSGTYGVTFTATNDLTGFARTMIRVVNVDRGPQVVAAASADVDEVTTLRLDIAAADADGDSIASLVADLSSLPAGNGAVFTANATRTGGTLVWTPTYADSGVYRIGFRASNALSSSAFTSIVVHNVDRAPVITVVPTVIAPDNESFTLEFLVADPDGDAVTSLTADLSSLPAGGDPVLETDDDLLGGTVTWTPRGSDRGPYLVTIVASNAVSGSAQTRIQVDHHPVVFAQSNVSVKENQQLTLGVTASDPDGQPITSLVADFLALPAGHNAVFAPNAAKTGGVLTWKPNYLHAPGPYAVRFLAANTLTGIANSSITVINIDRAPVLTASATALVTAGSMLTMTVSASDPDNEPITSLTADLSSLPPGHGATFVPNATKTAGTLTWTPDPDQTLSSLYNVTFRAANALSATRSTAITVDRAPVLIAPESVIANEGQPLTITVTASDPDAGQPIIALEADLSELPAGHNAVFTPNASHTAGVLQWTPGFDDAPGPYTVAFTAINTITHSTTTTIEVHESNQPLIVTAPATWRTTDGGAVSFTVTAADPDGEPIDSLSADLSGLPAGSNATFTVNATGTSGTFDWQPTAADGYGPYVIRFRAVNSLPGTAATTIINDRRPVVNVAAIAGAAENQLFQLDVTAADPDGETLTSLVADLSDLPAGHGAVFVPNSTKTGGRLSWTPTFNDGRVAPFRVRFTAGNTLAAVAECAVTVTNVDRPAVITVEALVRGQEGQPVTFTVSASDPDQDPVAALAANLGDLPATSNATFTPDPSNATGTFRWTPASGMGRVAPYGVTFTASNALTASASVSIVINALPEVVFSASPASGIGPLQVQFNTAGSTDRDGTIASYAFDFGDGTPASGPQSAPAVSHLYAPGTYTASVRATDNVGGTSTATRTITVAAPPSNFVANGGFETNTSGWAKNGSATLARVAPGRTGSFCLEVASTSTTTFGITDEPNSVTGVGAPGLTYRVTAWVRSPSSGGTAKIKLREFLGGVQQGPSVYSPTVTLSPSWQLLSFNYTALAAGSMLDVEVNDYPVAANEVLQVDDMAIAWVSPATMAPVITAPATVSVSENGQVIVPVTVTSVEGQAITSLSASLAGLPAGSNATFVPGASNATGTLTWTPTYADGRTEGYPLTFTASNGLTASVSTNVFVTNVDRAPVLVVPASVSATAGAQISVEITASDPDGDAITAMSVDLSQLPANHGAVFVANSTNTAGTLTWTPDPSFVRGDPFAVTFTARNVVTGAVTVPITVNRPPSGINLVGNPGFESAITGWAKTGSATLMRIPAGRNGSYALQITSSAGTTFGITDEPNWIANAGSAGTAYRISAWVRAASAKGSIKIKVREFVGGVQQGSSAYSDPIVLSTSWKEVTIDYLSRTADSYLDIEINDYPVAANEVFIVDDISIVRVSGGASAASAVRAGTPAPAFGARVTSNPVGPQGELLFTTTREGRVRLRIFDAQGRAVSQPINEAWMAAGSHRIALRAPATASAIAAGAYFYRLDAAEGVIHGRFTIVN